MVPPARGAKSFPESGFFGPLARSSVWACPGLVECADSKDRRPRVFLSRIQHTIHIAPLKVFQKGIQRIVVWPCSDFLGRNRTGGPSVIGYHLPQSVSVFVRELFR